MNDLHETKLPLLPLLLGGPQEKIFVPKGLPKACDPFKLPIFYEEMERLSNQIIKEFTFNEDQIKYIGKFFEISFIDDLYIEYYIV